MSKPAYDHAFWEALWAKTLRNDAVKVARRPPNAHLTSEAQNLPSGRALDAGCGHGAESLWLAAHGWDRRKRIVACLYPEMSRKSVPETTATEVVAANQHTCCICRERRRHVQLHHIDGDPSNNNPQNLAVLCLDDHSRVTGDEGLGRRFTPREVTQYKSQWEEICARADVLDGDDEEDIDDDPPDEPLLSCFRSLRIRPGENRFFHFAMEAGQELIASISADEYVNTSICTFRDYERWLDGEDLLEYEGEEDVRECELPPFTAPKKGEYGVVVINDDDDEDVDVTVDISIWASEDGEDEA